MKIRNGFVTNSSSSSFVVAFPHAPKSAKEIKKLLFGDEDTITWYDDSSSTLDVAKQVFNDIKGQKPNDFAAIVQAMDTEIDYDDFTTASGEFDQDALRVAEAKIGKYEATTFIKEAAESLGLSEDKIVVYVFDYADGGGQGLMEHGEIFNALPHRRFSHH